jgi:hypothetical protein
VLNPSNIVGAEGDDVHRPSNEVRVGCHLDANKLSNRFVRPIHIPEVFVRPVLVNFSVLPHEIIRPGIALRDLHASRSLALESDSLSRETDDCIDHEGDDRSAVLDANKTCLKGSSCRSEYPCICLWESPSDFFHFRFDAIFDESVIYRRLSLYGSSLSRGLLSQPEYTFTCVAGMYEKRIVELANLAGVGHRVNATTIVSRGAVRSYDDVISCSANNDCRSICRRRREKPENADQHNQSHRGKSVATLAINRKKVGGTTNR